MRLGGGRALVVLVAVLLTAVLLVELGDDGPGGSPRRGDGPERVEGMEGQPPERSDRPRRRGSAGGGRERRTQRPTVVVTDVVDGDTVDLANGETVRLVGIDTPEVGECGYERAKEALTRLALGRRVALGASDEDRDQYGRLLRYLDVRRGGRYVDAGYLLLRRGLAVARYDSRDGYGRHPRQGRYVARDAVTAAAGCGGVRGLVGQPQAQPRPRRGCAPGYRPCVPPFPPDVDCTDVSGPVRVTGGDPHALDADGDGRACES